jgi:hypothetical protein
MSNYTKATNFTAKDTLPTGNSGKIVKGTEIDTELTAIASAISSKADINSPALTGTPTAPTASATTNTTQVATTAFVRTEITALGTIGTMAAQNANAVAITGGTVTGITDLTVADGGTGASSITANSVILGNGSSALSGNLVAPGTTGNVLTSNGTTWTSAAPVLGLGNANQTYTDVTGSRTNGTTYTNSTGSPIFVMIWGDDNSGQALNLVVTVNSVALPSQSGSPAGSTTAFTFIVPVGKTYSVSWNASASVTAWWELR